MSETKLSQVEIAKLKYEGVEVSTLGGIPANYVRKIHSSFLNDLAGDFSSLYLQFLRNEVYNSEFPQGSSEWIYTRSHIVYSRGWQASLVAFLKFTSEEEGAMGNPFSSYKGHWVPYIKATRSLEGFSKSDKWEKIDRLFHTTERVLAYPTSLGHGSEEWWVCQRLAACYTDMLKFAGSRTHD